MGLLQSEPDWAGLTLCAPQTSELLRNVAKLWQVDIFPYRNERTVTHSRQDKEALDLLETKTTQVEVNGVLRYATPLLRMKDMPVQQAFQDSVMPNLQSTEKHLSKDPEHSAAYCEDIQKLIQAGAVAKLNPQALTQEGESWFIPPPHGEL